MEKKQHIENAAIELAKEKGLINITRKELCDKVGISDGSFYDVMDESFTDFIKRLGEDGKAPIGEATERKRTVPGLRSIQVLQVAIELAKTKGYDKITREDVATGANVTPALISHYFKSTEHLRKAVLLAAVKNGVYEIVAQGLTHQEPIAIQAPQELKKKAADYLAGL